MIRQRPCGANGRGRDPGTCTPGGRGRGRGGHWHESESDSDSDAPGSVSLVEHHTYGAVTDPERAR